MTTKLPILPFAVLLTISLVAAAAPPAHAQALRVCATTSDLADLTATIGGEAVEAGAFAKGPSNPHFVEARPSFIRDLSRCGLYVQSGLDLEVGWAPVLLQNSRNARVQPGARGYLDASTAIVPLEVPTGLVDRSMGDVHAAGNPHYLLDPLNGLAVAALLKDRLAMLLPDRAELFQKNFETFRRRLLASLLGEVLVEAHDPAQLAEVTSRGALGSFLKEHGEEAGLGGWLGTLAPFAGAKVVGDHNLWSYFARRYGLQIVGYLEPKPGVPPTTAHLEVLIGQIRREGVRAVFSSVYFDPRPVDLVVRETGVRPAAMAHQVGSRPGTGSYLEMCDYNVREVLRALGGSL